MTDDDELRLIRQRLDLIEARLDAREADSPDAQGVLLVRTAAFGTYPTGGPKVYAAHPERIDFPPTENAVPTFTVQTAVWVYFAALKSTGPAVGTNMLLESAGDRWVGVD